MSTVRVRVVNPTVEVVTPEINPDWVSQGLKLVEYCGRVSHKSDNRITDTSAIPFIRKIAIKLGHESILEHATFTSAFIGSRAMSHQLVRHRIAAITQESQRYCDYSKHRQNEHPTLNVVVPPTVEPIADGSIFSLTNGVNMHPTPATNNGNHFIHSALQSYREFLLQREEGVPPEDARHLLPNATKTEVNITLNWRMWRHLFKMRLDKHAQWEIRSCTKMVFDYFKQHCPLLTENLTTLDGQPL